jgi:septal ring factor EnvC (AmiA/AmiB activator)
MTVLDDLKKLEASIVKRYRELQPALAEVEELRRVADRLGVNLDSAAAKPATARARRASPKPARRARAKSSAPRRGRTSKRRDQVLKLITDRPGISVPEIGKALKVDPTGLYRYVKQLEADGSITKNGTELHPVAG